MPLIDRIALYQKYDVALEILVTHYRALCLREEPPLLAEAEVIGMKTTLLIYNAREKSRVYPVLPPPLHGARVAEIINTLFGVGLQLHAP